MTALSVPELSLVVLVGATGSGKSTFVRDRFAATEILSSDAFRAMVADDENDQSATRDAFDALHHVAGLRLAAGRLTVVDATNVQPHARRSLVQLARSHDVAPVAIVLDVPESVCAARTEARPDRTFGREVVHRQVDLLRRGLRDLRREDFRAVHVLRGVEQIDAATITRTRLRTDLRHETGPFDVIGDVHGCHAELVDLLGALGYTVHADGAHHPDGRRAVFVGDLVDRGPETPEVLRLVMGMVGAGDALCVPGNHDDKLLRALRGRPVRRTHGLAESLIQLDARTPEFRASVVEFLDGLVSHYVLDDGRLVVCHAGLVERYRGRASRRVRQFCLFGETTGETDEFGLPIRHDWAREYRGTATVLYGHTPTPEPEWINNTLCLDTGCVFGGRLTALRYPERELVSVPARAVHYEPVRPLVAPDPPARADDDLRLADVLSSSGVETSGHGRVSVRAEQAAAALEVMSRFAMDPRVLLYLPPTMSPVATSPDPDLLEHPEQAFDAYRHDGLDRVVCQEKHMGSRAVALVCAEPHARFGGVDGALWTRTGRPFFAAGPTAELVAGLRAAATAAGLFAELDTPWLLFDAELLPWNAKAEPLLRERYAATGAAARAALPAALAVLEAAAERGQDVDDLLGRLRERRVDAEAFSDAYRRYVTPVDGLRGIRVAPFQLLASSGAAHHTRPHAWHLDIADRLVAAAPDLVAPTRNVEVDLHDPASTAAGTAWWHGLVDAGGEGMVVKPLAGGLRGRRGQLVQPGLKVRGPEYLRLVYGPDYRRPATLARLRDRRLGHKRSLALREYALGVEALDRVAADEPTWRVHECVFAVLALESDPVDPRL